MPPCLAGLPGGRIGLVSCSKGAWLPAACFLLPASLLRFSASTSQRERLSKTPTHTSQATHTPLAHCGVLEQLEHFHSTVNPGPGVSFIHNSTCTYSSGSASYLRSALTKLPYPQQPRFSRVWGDLVLCFFQAFSFPLQSINCHVNSV